MTSAAECRNISMNAAYDKWLNWLYEAEQAKCDHKVENDASIGPDSGTETLYCQICGWSHRIIWY